jgi:hypothetical protein
VLASGHGPDSVLAAKSQENSAVLVSAVGPEDGAEQTRQQAASSDEISLEKLDALIQDAKEQRQAALDLALKVQEQAQITAAAARAAEEARLNSQRAELDAQAYASRVLELEKEVAAKPDNQKLLEELARFREVAAQAQAQAYIAAGLVRQAQIEHDFQKQVENALRRDLAIQREIELAARKNLADYLELARGGGIAIPAGMEREAAALAGLTGESANSRAAFLAHRDKLRRFNRLVAGMKNASLEDRDLHNFQGLLGREIIGLDLEDAIRKRKAIERATAFLLDGLRAGMPQADESPLLYLPDYQGPAAMDFWTTYNQAQNIVTFLGGYYAVASLDTRAPVDWESEFFRFTSPRRNWVDPREYDPFTGDTRAVSNRSSETYVIAGLIIVKPPILERVPSHLHYDDNCAELGMKPAYEDCCQ